MSKEITIRVINSGRVHWHNFKFLQSDSLKDLSKKSHQALKDSIINNNFLESFKVWQSKNDLFCLDGFHRCKILEELEKEGYKIPKLMPVDFLECKDKREASKLVVVFTAKYARITEDGLSQFLEEQKLDWDDFKSEIDWSDFNLDRFEAGRGNGYNPKEDDVPDPPKDPVSKLGELYLLGGRHRLLCGDATKPKDVERLMDGNKAEMVFTDPPYGINIVSNAGKLGGSDKTYSKVIGDGKEFDLSFLLAIEALHIIWGGNFFAHYLPKSTHWIVWDKRGENMIGGSEAGTQSDCELAWTDINRTSVKKYKHVWAGWFREGNKKEELSTKVHPTQKPVGLLKGILNDYSKENEIVLDLFGGSGSTLIACEQTNRTCYMSEIEPVYIDIIIERYKNLTGKEVELIDRIKTKKRRSAK